MGEVDQKGRDLATVDVTIRGAGVFGLSVAYACAKRGARVRVIDPGGVAAGASGGVVGALAPHTPEHWNAKKAFQFECLIGAAGYWRGIEELSGLSSGYGRHGRLQPIADARALEFAKRRAESSVALWGEHAVWEIVEAGEWAPVSATGLCIHDTLSGRIDPKRGCLALAGAIEALGGEVCLDGRDEGAVVWATGAAGLADLSAQMGAVVGMGQKGQAAVLEYDARGLPQLFAEGIHVIPHADGTVAVGSTSEREFDGLGVDGLLEDVIARARELFPALQSAAVLRRWAGVRPRAKSRAPMVGRHPMRSGEFIANGGFKIGFGIAPGIGEMLADLVLDGVDRVPEDFAVSASL